LSITRWTVLCAIAEAIGMTAAASAAKASQAAVGEVGSARQAALALTIVVGGGLVEGIALGALQTAGLRRPLPRLGRRWLVLTALVAGLGWAAASAPTALSGADDGSAPPLLLVLCGALGLGAAMGALLGAVQASVLRGHVRHPWRWVGASAVAWAPAMAVIFLGATVPGADWSVAKVAGLGTVTGIGAGAVLGLVSGWFLPTLDGSPARNRLVLRVLESRAHGKLDRSLLALRVYGVVTGRAFELPVQYATVQDVLVIAPGRPRTKRWWRNLRGPSPVDVLMRGQWHHGEGHVLHPGDHGYAPAMAAYRNRWPRARLPSDCPLVQIRFTDARLHEVDDARNALGHLVSGAEWESTSECPTE
jgi:hypothetical protein